MQELLLLVMTLDDLTDEALALITRLFQHLLVNGVPSALTILILSINELAVHVKFHANRVRLLDVALTFRLVYCIHSVFGYKPVDLGR